MANKYAMVKCYFEHGLWSPNQVLDAVSKGMITSDEYRAITGKDFDEETLLKKNIDAKKYRKLKQYIVHTFTDRIFSGNPAAVCVVQEELSDELMQKITIETRLTNTCFAVKKGEHYSLRLFTPGGETDICGHATLAAAHVVLNLYEKKRDSIDFDTLSGIINVVKNDNVYEIALPVYGFERIPVTDLMEEAFGVRPIEAYWGKDMLCVFENEQAIAKMKPKVKKMMQLDGTFINVTAKADSDKYDFVSRCFAPKFKVAEDPISGASYCLMAPYWFEKLGKNVLAAKHVSKRGGLVYCKNVTPGYVTVCGKAVLYSDADIYIDM